MGKSNQISVPVEDGRRARSRRTREAVVTALYDLLAEGNPRPSIDDVSERAGVSRRAIFNHFGTVEEIYTAVVMKQAGHIAEVFHRVDSDLTLDERLDGFVVSRSQLFEMITPIRSAAVQRMSDSRSVFDAVEIARASVKADTIRIFSAELEALPETLRAERTAALNAFGSWSSWRVLRAEQRLSVDAAAAALRAGAEAILKPPTD